MLDGVHKPDHVFMDCFTYGCSAAPLTGDQRSRSRSVHRIRCSGYTAAELQQSTNKEIKKGAGGENHACCFGCSKLAEVTAAALLSQI